MTTKIAAVFIFFSACATGGPVRTGTGAGPSAALRDAPDPRHGLPPATPMTDPETAERRFGFGEARVRREAGQRRAHDHDQLGVVDGGPARKPNVSPVPTPALRDDKQGDAKASCPCKQKPEAGH